MRRPIVIAGGLAAATLGVMLLAAPGQAAGPMPSPSPSTCIGCDVAARGAFGRGAGMGSGMGAGTGARMGAGMGAGMGSRMARGAGVEADAPCLLADGAAQGTLTSDQKARLAAMAEEEKLAHDVYVELAKSSGDVRFARLAGAESRHVAAVRALMVRYAVSDPTAGRADGQFSTPATATAYASFVADGKASLDAALVVGRAIERADIADLKTAGTGVTAADVTTVYSHLSTASGMHLRVLGA